MSTANLAASIRQRLKNYAKEHGESFNLVLVRFGLERLLFRITRSSPEKFVLKGGALFYCWTEQMHRPTRDIDLLSSGDPDPENFRQFFNQVINIEADDGLDFDSESLNVAPMKEGEKYPGVRVSLVAYLEKARISLQVDIGFGDATVPTPETVDYPVLLDLPSPRIRAYRKETVIAEKLQAIVDLGIANSRMKDFFDLWTFAKNFDFEGEALCTAIEATFARRETAIPESRPLAFSIEFTEDASKQKQWRAFANRLNVQADLTEVTESIARFLMPCLEAIHRGTGSPGHWHSQDWTA